MADTEIVFAEEALFRYKNRCVQVEGCIPVEKLLDHD